MNENRVFLEFSQPNINEINSLTQNLINQLQPYLISVDINNQKSSAKIKGKSMFFVKTVVQNIEELKDFNAFFLLNNILGPLKKLNNCFDDLVMLSESEVYKVSATYYDTTFAVKMNLLNGKTVNDDLKVCFKAQKIKKNKPKLLNNNG